ncbi:polymorphic toxin-type HINT domain-containing protein [Micromonospora fulviviridis]|uniref:polymorphic toxin-type HINT domain-containing protein n=1 Tax=Micromonospora fulviviridis TaxID=47860 RepID=UPI001E340434|nr:polymorphic toxin-type HINT domain-containing protein [Micromonospora fulviviridis]
MLVSSFLQPTSAASASEPAQDRAIAVSYVLSGGPSLRRAAEAALLGTEDDLRAFLDTGHVEAQEADERAAAQVLAGMDGPAMRAAALQALAGSAEDVRAFVNGGWKTSWATDERTRAYRLLESGGPTMQAAAQNALNGTQEELNAFLSSGRDSAERADDRLAATRMLTGAANNSGPVLNAAAQQALAGTPEELREFLESGQFVARARDQELASIRSLTEQAKQASEVTARESLAASEASTRAANAAAEAKKAAETAAAETAAAGNSAKKASAAAARAADAAAGAADAARDAIGASNAAMRAAQVASDAARKATTAASLTAQAASRAQQAAAAARTDAGKAAAARQAAQAARDAAAKAKELNAVKAQRDRALAQAKEAATAAKNASGNADAAAAAADQAGNQAGVSAAEAQRARDAAARARRAAAAAARAADRAYALAQQAAKASDDAFRYAEQAVAHAEAAAAAADLAADKAGEAATAAAESAKHAAAAVEAANIAVAAANQAVQLEQLARDEDAARLAEATEQGVQAAQDALAQEEAAKLDAGAAAAWNRKLLWDTAEEDRVDPATRKLLDEAIAGGAPTDVVLDRGRRAAAMLMQTGGEWTRAAAEETLTGGETELRSWLTEGRKFAVGQDDRARVWHLIDTLPDGNEKTAAQTALTGDDAAVQQFLRTRSYLGKSSVDRQAIYKILETAGPTLKAAAEKALAGTNADRHQFLRSGQYPPRTADERLEIYRIVETGGPEVKAAGQVALAGPPSYISYFLTAGRYKAEQRDYEQSTHVSAVRALIVQAQQYAASAQSDAAEANRVAAVAAGKAAEANTYAQQAAASASQAAQYATQAQQSAAAAKQSADQAAQSAATARNAANSAQASANQAAKSATTATAASKRAQADAQAAYGAALKARADAKAAGADAIAADLAAKEASATYTNRLKEFEAQQRSTAPGSGSDGTGTAADEHKTWGCLAPDSALSERCVTVYKDFAGAMIDPAKCASPANSGRAGCQMLSDLKGFVDQNPDLLLDMLQFVLGMCGLIPGVGEVCDAADAAISFKRGDIIGGLLSIGAAVPVVGYLASGAKGLKNADKLRNITNIIETLSKACKNSFAPGSSVLMADGSRKPIENVRVGDTVLSTDPRARTTAAQAVTATIVGVGSKTLVDVMIDDDSDGSTPASTVVATDNHPFWLPELSSWVNAEDLVPGQRLAAADGTLVKIEGTTRRFEEARVYNLTVEEFHTYYVGAGVASVLVHNAGCGPALFVDPKQFGKKWGKHAEDYGLDAANPAHRAQFMKRIQEIHDGPHEVRIGPIQQDGPDHLMYVQGEDLLITKTDGTFVSLYPGANTSTWFAGGKPVPCSCSG